MDRLDARLHPSPLGWFRRLVPVALGLSLVATPAAAAAGDGGPSALPAPAATQIPTARGSVGKPVSYGGWGSGYVAYAPAGKRFTAVSTTFVLPRHAPPAPTQGVAWAGIWAGIGIHALGHSQLMQAGVYLQTAAGQRGWSLEAPWWINEPANPTAPHELMLNVEPGDRVTVLVAQSAHRADHWSFRLKDHTNGFSASGRCSGCSSVARTAAWILEDPYNGTAPYANPGRVRFLDAAAAVGFGKLRPISQLTVRPVLREAMGQTQGPVASRPGSTGGFTLNNLNG